jgi:soluble lytic murein transglycosylase-like protein
MRVISVVLIVWLGTVLPASAQIYAWRDASGNLIVSNKPESAATGVTTYEVPGTTMRTVGGPVQAASSRKYDDLIREHAENHGISADLVRAVIQAESGFNPRAVSPKGAMGLMQLMPATARELGVANPFSPDDNIRAGTFYLATLLARFDQDVVRALAAYNAGAGRVEQYNGVPPYRETQDYVKKITSATKVAAPPPIIYKWIEMVNGEPKLRFSNTPPKDRPYEIVGKR